MPSSLERRAVSELIARAKDLGVPVPAAVHAIGHGDTGSHAAATYAAEHPEDDNGWPTGDVPDGMIGCCYGSVGRGLAGCTCWVAVYDTEQADPIPLRGPEDLKAQPRMCGDCAFRKDSPERRDAYMEDTLLALPSAGEPFWCHDGMRRPARWEHPAGAVVEGSPDDWQPPMVGSVPYRLDGNPGLLCHGWAVRAAKARA